MFSALSAVGNPQLLIFSHTLNASRFRLLLRGDTAKFPYRERPALHTQFRSKAIENKTKNVGSVLPFRQSVCKA